MGGPLKSFRHTQILARVYRVVTCSMVKETNCYTCNKFELYSM